MGKEDSTDLRTMNEDEDESELSDLPMSITFSLSHRVLSTKATLSISRVSNMVIILH